jgi:hypothetical protein
MKPEKLLLILSFVGSLVTGGVLFWSYQNTREILVINAKTALQERLYEQSFVLAQLQNQRFSDALFHVSSFLQATPGLIASFNIPADSSLWDNPTSGSESALGFGLMGVGLVSVDHSYSPVATHWASSKALTRAQVTKIDVKALGDYFRSRSSGFLLSSKFTGITGTSLLGKVLDLPVSRTGAGEQTFLLLILSNNWVSFPKNPWKNHCVYVTSDGEMVGPFKKGVQEDLASLVSQAFDQIDSKHLGYVIFNANGLPPHLNKAGVILQGVGPFASQGGWLHWQDVNQLENQLGFPSIWVSAILLVIVLCLGIFFYVGGDLVLKSSEQKHHPSPLNSWLPASSGVVSRDQTLRKDFVQAPVASPVSSLPPVPSVNVQQLERALEGSAAKGPEKVPPSLAEKPLVPQVASMKVAIAANTPLVWHSVEEIARGLFTQDYDFDERVFVKGPGVSGQAPIRLSESHLFDANADLAGDYWVFFNGNICGPLSLKHLKASMSEGKFGPEALTRAFVCQRTTAAGWHRLETLEAKSVEQPVPQQEPSRVADSVAPSAVTLAEVQKIVSSTLEIMLPAILGQMTRSRAVRPGSEAGLSQVGAHPVHVDNASSHFGGLAPASNGVSLSGAGALVPEPAEAMQTRERGPIPLAAARTAKPELAGIENAQKPAGSRLVSSSLELSSGPSSDSALGMLGVSLADLREYQKTLSVSPTVSGAERGKRASEGSEVQENKQSKESNENKTALPPEAEVPKPLPRKVPTAPPPSLVSLAPPKNPTKTAVVGLFSKSAASRSDQPAAKPLAVFIRSDVE